MTPPKDAGNPAVEVGQVWGDRDERTRGRTFRVEQIVPATENLKAIARCIVLTNGTIVQRGIDAGDRWYVDRCGKETVIALDSFRSARSSRGYELVRPAD